MEFVIKNKVVQSLTQVDLSDLKFPIVVIYDHPEDFPDKFVARIWDVDKPTNTIIVRDTLEEIREDVWAAKFIIQLPRSEFDDKCIVESWM